MVSFACITIFVPVFRTSRLPSSRRTLVFPYKNISDYGVMNLKTIIMISTSSPFSSPTRKLGRKSVDVSLSIYHQSDDPTLLSRHGVKSFSWKTDQ